jgi:hypothetical protein
MEVDYIVIGAGSAGRNDRGKAGVEELIAITVPQGRAIAPTEMVPAVVAFGSWKTYWSAPSTASRRGHRTH